MSNIEFSKMLKQKLEFGKLFLQQQIFGFPKFYVQIFNFFRPTFLCNTSFFVNSTVFGIALFPNILCRKTTDV